MSSLSAELSALFPLFQIVETRVGPVSDHAVQLCTQNSLRWALWLAFNAVPNQNVYISTRTDQILQSAGIPVVLGDSAQIEVFQAPLLNFRDHGPLVQQAWYGGQQATITHDWTVIEVLLLTEGAVY